MADVNNENLELHEVERPRDLYEDAMRLSYEKMDLEDELQGLSASGFDVQGEDKNAQAKKLEVEIALIDQQIDSLAQQWADAKVLDIVNDPDRRAKRIAARKEHFLNRLTCKLKRNERRLDRYEEDTEDDQRKLDRRVERWTRREERIDARQEARRARNATLRNPRRAARRDAREDRRDARQERRLERKIDRLQRRTDRVNDHRDENTVVYDKAALGDPGAPISSVFPTYDRRGDQLTAGALRDAAFYGDNPEAMALSQSADMTDSQIVRNVMGGGASLSELTLGDNRSFRVIDIVYASEPEMAAYYKETLVNGSPLDREDALAELSERQAELQNVSATLDKSEVARRQLEKASLQDTIWDKFSGLLGEIGRNPGAMAAIATLGVGMYLLRDDIPFKKVGKVIGGIALVGAGIYTADFFWEKLDKEHRGLFDRLGFKPSDAVNPEILSKFKNEHFPRMPQKERDSVDEMIHLLDVPMSSVNDAFRRAQENHETAVDTSTFLGSAVEGKSGVSSRAESHMDGTDLFRGLRWFYIDSANQYLAQNPGRGNLTEAQKLDLGLQLAENPTNATKSFGEYNVDVNVMSRLHSASSNTEVANGRRVTTTTEAYSRSLNYPSNAHLNSLVEQVPSSRGVLLGLPTGEVLVQGYPYEYAYTDQGKYVFTDAFDESKSYVIDSAQQPGEMSGQLRALVSQSEGTIQEKFAAFKGSTDSKIIYVGDGLWSVEPALPRNTYKGVDTGSEGIKTFFYADASGFHLAFNGARKDQSFATLEEVQKAYDLQVVFPALVTRDAGHLLLNVPFEVKEVKDVSEDTTTVRIAYDGGHQGTLTYTKGVLAKVELANSADLDTAWDHQAKKQTVELFARPVVQDRIISKLGLDPDVYVRWHNTVTTGLVSSEPNIPFTGGLFGTAGKTFSDMFFSVVNSNDITGNTVEARQKLETEKEVDQKLGELIVQMNTELKALLALGLPELEYKQKKDALMQSYEEKINLILATEADPTLTADEFERMKKEAEKQVEDALSPMKHLFSTDGNQEALYQERLYKWQQEALKRIDALATGGSYPTKNQVEAIIADVRNQASTEATPHRGLDAATSAEILTREKLNGVHAANWAAATDILFTYLSNNYKWEQYAVLDKRENLKDLVDLYYEKIENGAHAATPEDAKNYVQHYFLPIVYMELGGKDDFSLDRFYAQLNAVSDTQYQAARAKLGLIKPYTAWLTKKETFSSVPELNESYREEQDKDVVMEGFMKEFDQHIQIGTLNPTNLEFWDHKWPEYWRGSVERRARAIRAFHEGDATYTSAEYQKELVDFRKFVAMEHNIFQLLIQHRIEPKHKGKEIEDILQEDFAKHWYNRDYQGYYNEFYYKVLRPDNDWWPELDDSIIEEAHDGYGLDKLFNIPFL